MTTPLHPLLQPTRAQRIRYRVIDTIGTVFWIAYALAILAGLTGMLFFL